MLYDQILIRYGEITTKSKNRQKFIDALKENVLHRLKDFPKIRIEKTRDRMFIKLNGENHFAIMDQLETVFGIHSYSLALRTATDLEEMKSGALYAFHEAKGQGHKTFKVNVKRSYKQFPLDTQQLNFEIGGHLLDHTDDVTVDVRNPEIEVRIEVREGDTYISSYTRKGAGGLPVGSSGKALLLLSGGIDSPVAGYLTMKRGVALEAIHFHSPPYTNDRAKQKVLDLAGKLTSYSKKVKVHLVPFTDIQTMIQKQIPSNYSMTVMRRMMLRIAEQIAERNEILALATGESLGQVASQTLASMNTINEVTNIPIIRPVITMDKLEIIELSKKINTYDISIRPFEDCCTIFTPASPATKPKREKANRFESFYDFSPLIEDAINRTEVVEITEQTVQSDSKFEDLF
ncbi:thiamine biosynthesis protein ThiI [Bacillus mesophilus]|uniref:Probable tRNA sulfurtransferase n=1 Tax=Bacillus mesophilus TaxID=1808955 RepID=A0A6M0Q6G8_9BACI|nr:tRNA uracil 4-sulfurtransferase ThiI [Bacillus mesophilus]MBM7660526.1 thiamine biosynthesis protein ThiI [Bacillus mesophilus]NEY71925.1 tRNA 4-thiouridine(8) synthase ThiI [Bacillus mesophilus]